MIDKIQIEGFQKYKDKLVLKLHPGLNVIVGSSDSGKSTIIRAERWLSENKPKGEDFKHWDLLKKDPVRVTNKFSDGGEVVREKCPAANKYIVNGEDYKAIHTNVPSEVSQITKLKPINIQSQHPNDQYFLLTKSPGQVAREFNEVAGLSVMDKAMKEVNSQVRANNTNLKVIKEQIQETGKKLHKLSWVPKALKLAKRIQNLIKKKKLILQKAERVQDVLQYLKGIDLSFYNTLSKSKKALKTIQKENERLCKIKNQKNTLLNIISGLSDVDKCLQWYDDLTSAVKDLKKIKSKADKQNDLEMRIWYITDYIEEIMKLGVLITEKEVEIAKGKGILKKKIRKSGCPICGNTNYIGK